MFFTIVGTILAYIVFVLSLLRFAIGIFVATYFDDAASRAAAASRYLGSKTSGEAIDQATVWILASVALGILCEISRSIRANSN